VVHGIGVMEVVVEKLGPDTFLGLLLGRVLLLQIDLFPLQCSDSAPRSSISRGPSHAREPEMWPLDFEVLLGDLSFVGAPVVGDDKRLEAAFW